VKIPRGAAAVMAEPHLTMSLWLHTGRQGVSDEA